MPTYQVKIPVRIRNPDGGSNEDVRSYTIKSSGPFLAMREGERQALAYLQQLRVDQSIIGWYIHNDKIDVCDSKNGK